MTERGKCNVCGYRFPLRKDGTMQSHRLWSGGIRLRPCDGTGKRPSDGQSFEDDLERWIGRRSLTESSARP